MREKRWELALAKARWRGRAVGKAWVGRGSFGRLARRMHAGPPKIVVEVEGGGFFLCAWVAQLEI